jgi:hypothetical protein
VVVTKRTDDLVVVSGDQQREREASRAPHHKGGYGKINDGAVTFV